MLKIFSRYVSWKVILLLVTENLWITGTLVLLVALRAHYFLHEPRDLAETAWKVALVTLVCQISLLYNDLYDLSVSEIRREMIIRALESFGASSVILGILYAVFPDLIIGNGIVAVFAVLMVVILLAWRMLVSALSRAYEVPRRVLVVGTGELAVDLVRSILKRPDLNLKVVGFLTDSPEEMGRSLVNPKVIGMHADLEEIVATHAVDRVVVALPDRRKRLPVRALLNLKLSGTTIDDAYSLYEKVTGKIRITALPPSWLVFSDGFRAISRKVRRKRFLDLVLAVGAGIFLLPVAALVAVLVKLTSPGSVLFRQRRVGLHGRTFELIKFRTMRRDAEADGVPRWSIEDDPRITPLGRFLRKARLDEIPQIWNVLVGDMSFVGPRPERPYFVELLSERIPYYNERHVVRPGITGWAQISYRYGSTVEDALEKLQYDLFYIKNLSALLDLAILFETGKIVLFGTGR